MISSITSQQHLARLLAACALAMQLIACDDAATAQPISEPAGSADYYLDNQTSLDLTIEWTTSPGLGSETRQRIEDVPYGHAIITLVITDDMLLARDVLPAGR